MKLRRYGFSEAHNFCLIITKLLIFSNHFCVSPPIIIRGPNKPTI